MVDSLLPCAIPYIMSTDTDIIYLHIKSKTSALILQTTFMNYFLYTNWCTLSEISLKFVPKGSVQLTINQHWFRKWLGVERQEAIILTLNVQGASYLGLTRSISWLLMPWLLASPGHQHPWYWLCKISKYWSYTWQDFNYLWHVSVEEWHKM